ncbi:hypothetical protein AVEN_121908-1 [Araneus ventricosus]|uniref:Mos1 transposase HTH domain-containing protein n=1 Tax=Araneus ventricosus TaxID=182803 RepID=A0A4Y2J6A4_ARAVE|nr:hypothetical protein AVEN_121908-1 [Araneus ventricosus]
MDSSRSAQRAVIQFLRVEGEHASQIYRRMKEVYGEQRLSRCTIFRWCQLYEVGRVNVKDLPRPGQAHVVTNSATILGVDELIRQIFCSVGAQAFVRELEDCENECLPYPAISTLKPSTPFPLAGISVLMLIIYSCTIPHEL